MADERVLVTSPVPIHHVRGRDRDGPTATGLAAALALALTTLASPRAVAAQATGACSAGPVALVLAGGGVKGLAHVGVLQHLDSLGVVPDLVVGTSVGAIVGALYASGYDGATIEALVHRFNVGAYVGRYAPSAPRSLGAVLPLLTWQEGIGGGLDFSTAAVREGPVNLITSALMLAGNLRAAGDFDRLPTPFRAVAADLATGAPVVLAGGDLARAVRASFAIPLVFPPVPIDGRVLVDGGIAMNAPVDIARQAGARRVLLSEFDDSLAADTDLGSTASVAAQLLRFLFLRNPPTLSGDDVLVTTNTTGALPLDFSPATMRRMVERGRAAARRAVPSARCLPRGPRHIPPLPPRSTRADRAATRGPDDAARRLADVVFGRDAPARPPLDTVMTRLVHLGDGEQVRALWLHPRRGPGDSVRLDPELVLAPRRTIAAGLVYDNELGGRAWVGGVDRHALGLPLEAAVRGALGAFRQDLVVAVRRRDRTITLTRSPFTELLFARERVRLFTGRGVEVPDARQPVLDDAQLRVGIEQPVGATWTMQGALLARRLADAEVAPERITVFDNARTTWGGTVRFVRVRADPRFVPRLDVEYTDRYTRVLLATASTWRGRGARLTASTRLGWSDRTVPLLDQFTLGGDEGMAGLRLLERRGRAETFAALELGVPWLGPLAWNVGIMGGQVAADGARPLAGARIAGVRVGLGADTPIGPVRVQYGANTDRRSQWFLRLGRWF